MEILAPAGSPEALVAAIAGGADAVYLGGKQFGARKFSANFDDGEMEGAIEYAHDRNVNVYVTVNTSIKDDEMMAAISYVRFLKNIGADAVIVQDIGFLNAIRNIDIPKHASTQMGIHSREGLQWCHDNGISRAILSRELTLDEIEYAIKDSPIETEVFVQGALCYSMSGGCLFSSMSGGRSGNRGECAQPCRKRYTRDDREGYLLNTRDLYCVDILDRLESIGIDSVKIEGRMRAPVHSYLTAKVYSSAKAGVDDTESKKLLETIFNRGYGMGYMLGVENVVQPVYPDNRGLFLGKAEVRKGRFNPDGMDISLKDGISIFRGEEKIGGFKVSDMAVGIPFKIRDGIYEMYRTYDPRIDAVKNLIPDVPEFTGRTKRPPMARLNDGDDRKPGRAKLSAYVSSMNVLEKIVDRCDRIYFEMNRHLDDAKTLCSENGKELITILPRFTPFPVDVDGPAMIHNPGQAAYCRDAVYGSYHMNMFNSFFPIFEGMTLSAELSRNEIKGITKRYDGKVEVMVFGRTELMYTRDPEMRNGTLRDEKGFEFPVFRDPDGWSHILNSADLLLINHVTELDRMGVDSIGIDLRRRPARLADIVTDAFLDRDASHKEKIKEMCGNITYGHFLNGI